MGEMTTSHVEDVTEQGDNAKVHAKTYILIAAVNMTYVAQLVSVVGSASLGRSIAATTGSEGHTVWFTSAITISTAVLCPPISQAADYWGRKWLLVFFTSLGCAGSIVVSRANSAPSVLIGFILSGLAFGAQALVPTITSEVLPRRLRAYAQGFVHSVGALSGLISLLFGGALTRNGNDEGYRVYYYICAGIFAFSAILCTILYNPPQRNLEIELKFHEKIRKLDWPAYILLTMGIVFFCVGLSWSQDPYPWSDPHVSVPFAVGISSIVALVLYALFIKKDGMIHHKLFQNRNFPIVLGCLFVEGMGFFSVQSYVPTESSLLFTSDPVLVGAHLGVAFASSIFISGAGAAYSWKTKTLRPPAVLAYVSFIIFYVLAATVTTNTPDANFWIYPIFAGAGVGLCLASLMTAAQFATPMELISTTTGLVLAVRNVGGTVGLAVYNAVYNHSIASNLAPKVAAVTLPLGLPETSLVSLTAAIKSGDPQTLSAISGITPEIIATAGLALQETYVIAFRYVWVTAGAFSTAALIAAFFIVDRKADFNGHVDAPVEAEAPILDYSEKA
ncbi:hypothetical protein O988_04249 [Pseudogymnoascus sp. VKM F-3808]|nr:hypothetical protein O988_04249 [Pseudogymnoascus sp. VKM F-3808]